MVVDCNSPTSLRRKIFHFILLILFFPNLGTLHVIAAESSGSLLYGGLERTYRIHLPSQWDQTKPAPLEFLFHGGGGTGEGMEKLTLGGFNRLADREGFVVVYPDGIEKHWNDGRGLEAYRAHRENIEMSDLYWH